MDFADGFQGWKEGDTTKLIGRGDLMTNLDYSLHDICNMANSIVFLNTKKKVQYVL